jgi:hypothetical protein
MTYLYEQINRAIWNLKARNYGQADKLRKKGGEQVVASFLTLRLDCRS